MARLLRTLIFAMLPMALLMGGMARAACTSPAGVEGTMNYDFTGHVLYYCNNTSWVPASGSVSADSLDFTDFSDSMSLDASTSIAGTGTNALSIIHSGSVSALSITNTGTGNSFLVEDAASTDTTPFVISASGDVGIGTTSPNTKLTVLGNGAATIGIGDMCGTNYAGIIFTGQAPSGCANYNILSGSSDKNLYLNRPSGHGINFRKDNADQMVILDSGNVGIGTASPASKFDVAGGIKVANDAAACVTGKAGTLRYTGGSPPWQYCDGSGWVPFESAGGGAGGTITILSNQTNVNLFHAAGFPTEAGTWEFIVASGVTVNSSSASLPAIASGTFPVGSTVKITNNGNIYGKGGDGGAGGINAADGAAGSVGGYAISLGYAITIDNTNGNIFGGGGSGGGGGGNTRGGTGGGGGGGQGSQDSAGGSGSPAGSSGTAAGPGAGGNSSYGDGGTGGAWGTTGNSGADGPVGGNGGAGGAAGNAVKQNGNAITWLGGNNGTQVKGPVN